MSLKHLEMLSLMLLCGLTILHGAKDSNEQHEGLPLVFRVSLPEQERLRVKDGITIFGNIRDDAKVLRINFVASDGGTAYMFRVNFQLDEFEMNSYIEEWGQPLKSYNGFPLKIYPGCKFYIQIWADVDRLLVARQGEYVADIKYRSELKTVNAIEVLGFVSHVEVFRKRTKEFPDLVQFSGLTTIRFVSKQCQDDLNPEFDFKSKKMPFVALLPDRFVAGSCIKFFAKITTRWSIELSEHRNVPLRIEDFAGNLKISAYKFVGSTYYHQTFPIGNLKPETKFLGSIAVQKDGYYFYVSTGDVYLWRHAFGNGAMVTKISFRGGIEVYDILMYDDLDACRKEYFGSPNPLPNYQMHENPDPPTKSFGNLQADAEGFL